MREFEKESGSIPGQAVPDEGVRVGDLTALLARVEKAEGPDRELEVLVCVALGIMPVITHWPPELAEDWSWELRASADLTRVETWALHPTDKYSPNILYGRHPEPFTGSLDQALALCERVLPGARLVLGQNQTAATKPWARIGSPEHGADVTGRTLALAMIAALLKAKIAEDASPSEGPSLATDEPK